MRWLGWVGGILCIAVLMFASILFFASGESQTAAACTPSVTAIEEGSVTVGSGPASDAYFAHFGSDIVAEKKANAALIIQSSRKEGLTDYSTSVVIATALQESGLLNLPNGDRDSRGLFQQRPSVKIWGTAQEIMDPPHATKAFIDYMKAHVPNRDSMSLIDVAIAVQNPSRSAYHKSWVWNDVAAEIVKGASSESCAGGEAHLPLDPGYHVSDGFADPRPSLSIGSKPHIGIDMVYGSDTLGKTVYAAFSGVVIQSGYGGGCNASNNNPVMILTKEGFEIGYLHMNGQQILVQKGDAVVAGQKIGSIGSCGQSTGPHLHFEVTPANDHDSWLSSVRSVIKYGSTWLDPEGVMAHYGVKLLP